MLVLQNFQDHPTNRNKKVFFFHEPLHATHFENLLIEHKIEYEKQIDDEEKMTIYYGVKKVDFKATQRLNFLTIGKYRKPFIADKVLRLFVIAISVIVLGLAIAGAIITSL